MSAYREPGGDATEIACAKIREAEQTRREALLQREETRRKRITELGPLPHAIAGLVVIVIACVGSCTAESWLSSRTDTPCRETARVTIHGELRCSHPLHVLTQEHGYWLCRCVERALPALPDAGAHDSYAVPQR